jgi:hypothetical protein
MTWLGLAALASCAPDNPAGPAAQPGLELKVEPEGQRVTGGGQFEHPTLGPVNFALSALRHHDGAVSGRFEYHFFFATADPTSAPVMFKGDVTCFAVDLVNHRAWIGGVLTYSNDPDPDPIFSVGHDAWFRLLDNGAGGDADEDRITFIGFEGSAGIPTSEEYCALQIWPGPPTDAVNARTWPIVSGGVTIH